MIRMHKKNRTLGLKAAVVMAVASLLLGACGGGAGGGGGGTSKRGTGEDETAPGKFDAGSTMKRIQDRGKLIVGITPEAYPFAYIDRNTGEVAGFDVEIAKEIAKGIFGSRIEDKVQFLQIDARDREIALEGKRVDIALGRYAISVARKNYVDFAGPYYVATQAAVVKSVRGRTEGIDSVLELAGKKVCVVTGSTDVPALQVQAPGVDANTAVKTVQECGVLLQNGTVQGVVADYVDAQVLTTVDQLEMLPAYNPVPYGIGVQKGVLDFRTYINDRLENQIADVWDDLFNRSVGATGADGDQPPVDRY
jgi:ABC-type amino acid transport substrate-binding protein